VDDASGHYTTGYFWGNNYWTGSMTLCRAIYKTDDDSFFTKKSESSHDGLTTIHGNGAGARLKHENPPFLPRFGVLKVILNETFTTPTVRTFLFDLFI
jgi:Nose resistant-to-fluoxetine protein, N-terminal domain